MSLNTIPNVAPVLVLGVEVAPDDDFDQLGAIIVGRADRIPGLASLLHKGAGVEVVDLDPDVLKHNVRAGGGPHRNKFAATA
jgi:hypothetical protein